MLAGFSVKDLLEKVASKEPVPGGGSVAALSISLAAALIGMVGGLTIGKKSSPARDEIMTDLVKTAHEIQDRLLEDIDRDADAYAGVMAAFRLPKGSETDKREREAAIEAALKEAARVPLSVAEAGVGLLSLAEIAVTQGNPNAVTDGAVGVMMARSGVLGALYNVRINLASIKDQAFKEELGRRADHLEKKVREKERHLLALAASLIEKPH